MNYEDPILAKVRDLLNKYGPDELKGRYYIGDTFIVNKSNLPLGFISYERHDVVDSSSHFIETTSNILITIAVDLTKDFTLTNKRSGSQLNLVKMMCGRDKDYKLLEDTILGVLRRFQDENTGALLIDLGNPTQIEYRIGERGENVFTNEVTLRFTVKTKDFIE